MSLVYRIKKRIITDYYRAMFNKAAKRVLNTKPLSIGNLPFITLSMVQHRDVHAYLIAIKSFSYYAPASRVVVVCDPSLTVEDRDCMKHHIPHIEFREAYEFRHGAIPVGGTWERLSAISKYVTEAYTVQLDADTICTGPIEEVRRAVLNNTGFVLGEKPQQEIILLSEAAEKSKHWTNDHIQAVAEKSMEQVLGNKYYVRGCSGFTGFPKNSALEENMLEFSTLMSRFIGSRWSEWGTEQVASNYLIANCSDTEILPFPKYSTPPIGVEAVAFHHYIGHVRFGDGRYASVARSVLNNLK